MSQPISVQDTMRIFVRGCATILVGRCEWSGGARRIFMHLWTFVWGCLNVVGKWLFIPVKKWLNAWLLREK